MFKFKHVIIGLLLVMAALGGKWEGEHHNLKHNLKRKMVIANLKFNRDLQRLIHSARFNYYPVEHIKK